MMKNKNLIKMLIIVSILGLFCGCEKDPLDPIQIGRFRPTPVVTVILDSLGVAEEEEPKFEAAEEPRPVDLLEIEQDFVLGPGDFIDISIFELLEEGVPYADTFEISESGNISIPEIGQFQAAGLTEIQLEDEMKSLLSPTILRNPSVTVRLRQSNRRAFTMLGEGVGAPNRYLLPGYTFRLADALAQAGSLRQFNVDYVYVTRYENLQPESYRAKLREYQADAGAGVIEESFDDVEVRPVEPGEKDPSEELLEIIAPHTSKTKQQKSAGDEIIISAAETATMKELKALAAPDELELEEEIFVDDVDETFEEETVAAKPMRTEWIFQDGKWVAVQVEDESGSIGQSKGRTEVYGRDNGEQISDWPELTDNDQIRVIKIPARKIGIDPKYNIVIRPGDTINAPFNVVGEVVVMGNVNRQGYIDLTGRPMTLMQAIAAAGGLGPLAEPSRVEVRRRIGEKREQIVSVDLDKIASGLQPDFFTKKNDTINVGTLPSSRFAAVLRNAFRATYGFGFIYDRNFADRDFGTSRPLPNWF